MFSKGPFSPELCTFGQRYAVGLLFHECNFPLVVAKSGEITVVSPIEKLMTLRRAYAS